MLASISSSPSLHACNNLGKACMYASISASPSLHACKHIGIGCMQASRHYQACKHLNKACMYASISTSPSLHACKHLNITKLACLQASQHRSFPCKHRDTISDALLARISA
uniref:Uncharacterized protein n=1 Tax=Cannabis sativa TaxID=3483 RepID=A0A803PR75_CANSA